MPKPRFASKAASKAVAVAQLAGLAVAAGALVAAVAIPAVGFAGMATRDTATKFNTTATPELGQIPVRSELLDRHGKVLAYYYGRGIDRVPVSYAQISPAMRQAIVAIEDSRFYQHGAIDFKGTVRAIVNNLEHNPVQGGSTIAQQYVKNVLYLSSPNPQAAFAGATSETLGRKIRERSEVRGIGDSGCVMPEGAGARRSPGHVGFPGHRRVCAGGRAGPAQDARRHRLLRADALPVRWCRCQLHSRQHGGLRGPERGDHR